MVTYNCCSNYGFKLSTYAAYLSNTVWRSCHPVHWSKQMADKDQLFSQFYSEVKIIEKRDSLLTPKQQVDRLNRAGCTYFNLNPFDVMLPCTLIYSH